MTLRSNGLPEAGGSELTCEAGVEAEAGPEVEAEAEAGPEVEAEAEAGPEVEAEAEAEAEAGPEVEAEAEAEAVTPGEAVAMAMVVAADAGDAPGMVNVARAVALGLRTLADALAAAWGGDPAADVEPATSATVPRTAPPVATDIVTASAASAP
jgi:S-DNA-T family DNA segregation ATPase FtsK/SpoIIIE